MRGGVPATKFQRLSAPPRHPALLPLLMPRPQAVPPEATVEAPAPRAAAEPGTGAGVPIPLHLSELKSHHVTQLVEMAVANGIENASRMRKQDLIFALLKN